MMVLKTSDLSRIVIYILVLSTPSLTLGLDASLFMTQSRQATVAIGRPDSISGDWTPWGTGVLLYSYEPTPHILVTNRHILEPVSQSGKRGTLDRILVKADVPEIVKKKFDIPTNRWFEYNVRLRAGDTVLWTAHPDPSIDIAVLYFPPTDKKHVLFEKFSNYKYLSKSVTLPFDSLKIGKDILFWGFPLGLGALGKPQPVIRFGAISFIDSHNKSFLIDAQVFGGSSGSPVFLSGSSKVPDSQSDACAFIGIASGFQPSPLQVVSTSALSDSAGKQDSVRILVENSGLGMVFSFDLIQETIDLHHSRLAEREKKRMEAIGLSK